MRKQTLWYLTEEDGRVRQIVNNVVTSLNKMTPVMAPQGWNDFLLGWTRDMEAHGIKRGFSLPMGFVRNGMQILRNDFYKFNADRKLYLIIQRFVSEVYAMPGGVFKEYYKTIFKGLLDFSTGKDMQSEQKFEINILDGGLIKKMKAYEGTDFLIPFDDDAINVKLDGILLNGRYTWTILESNGGADHLVGMVLTGQEQKAPGIAVFDVMENFIQIPNNVDENSTDYFMASQTDLAGSFGWFHGRVQLKDPDPFQITWFEVHIWNTILGAQRPTVQIYHGPRTEFIDINFNTFTIQEGDRYFLACPEGFYEFELIFEILTRHPTTYVKGFKVMDVYKKLAELTGIGENNVISTLLENSPLVLTSGDGLRGFEESGIRTSLKEFLTAMGVLEFAGWGIENEKLVLEDRLRFYDSNPFDNIALGEAKEMVISHARDLCFGTIKIGHKEQEIEDVNGKYDFNGVLTFKTPVQFEGKTMEIISPYKAGPYEIEITRINFEGKVSTDSEKDNQIFILDVNLNDPEDIPDVGIVYPLDRSTVVNAGVPSPSTIFNVRYSPKRLFNKFARWFASFLYNYTGDVEFVQANRNDALSAGGVVEKANVPIPNLGIRIFAPYYLDFGIKVPINLQDTLKTTPNAPFTTIWEGVEYQAFILDAKLAPTSRQPQEFKMLLTNNNDPKTLIL